MLKLEDVRMRILAIVHEADAGPGVFAEAIASAGGDLDQWSRPNEPAPPRPIEEYAAVIALGGSMDPDQRREHPWLADELQLLGRLLEARVPLLGMCLGAELLAEAAGGGVRRSRTPEIGWYEVSTVDPAADDPLIGPLGPRFDALEWHSYEVALPPGAVALARSESCVQAFRVDEMAWGIQFHAEVAASDLDAWIEDHDADRETLRAASRPRIAGWNELGRGLCGRFLEVARARS